MYLSRLTTNPSSREFRRDHADIRQMHRTVMSAYLDLPEGVPARQSGAVLWRLDPAPRGFVQYVQSILEPDWRGMPAGYLAEPPQVRSLQPVLDAIVPGRRFAFRLVANPTRTVPYPADRRPADSDRRRTHGMRVPHRSPEKQLEWLIRRGEQQGFAIPVAGNGSPDIAVSPCLTLVGKKRDGDRGPIIVEPVRFDGHLIVTDAELFTDSLRNGIGRAKAYGCGLLSLAPARRA